MSNKIIFASSNQGKVIEVKALLKDLNIEILSLHDIDFDQQIQEPFDSFEENSAHKAKTIHSRFAQNCISDDSGLCVSALNGRPGVHTARYAGENASSDQNMDKLLLALTNTNDRSAFFMTVVTLIISDKVTQFEGKVQGRIATAKGGSQGFGYDPIFIPKGSSKTFAEMSSEEKSNFSHRAIAMAKMKAYLKEKDLF